MPTPRDRIQKLEEIQTILKENKGTITVGKLYGMLVLKHGVTKRTFWDYLEALKAADRIDYSDVYLAVKEDSVEIKLK